MKRATHPALFLGISLGCLAGSVLFFGGLYPSTYDQPDFGHSLAVMLLILIVCLASLNGVAFSIAGILVAKRWRPVFACLAALHVVLLCGTPLVFKFVYEGNEPLHATIKESLTEPGN